jgi:hypothetical protein
LKKRSHPRRGSEGPAGLTHGVPRSGTQSLPSVSVDPVIGFMPSE